MEEKRTKNPIISIHYDLRFRILLVLLLATVSIGETEMDQSSSNENIIENMISSSVSPTYLRTSQKKSMGTDIITFTETETGKATNNHVESNSKNMSTELDMVSNVTMSVITTSTNQLPGAIIANPTISYLDSVTVHYINGRGFSTPHFHISDARWGPFFEEGTEPQNITANLGSTVILDCRIGLLHDKTVTWLHHKDDSIHLLTVGRNVYSSDDRITLSFRYPNNWRLVIVYVSRHDEGLYECQVATHPPKVKRLYLKILVPEVYLVDELGREVTERYYKEGSTLELTCLGLQTNYIDSNIQREITWRQGEQTIIGGISSNISSSNNIVTSTLILTPIGREHSGNYTCAVNGLTSATVSIHVLNGESPAAVVGSSATLNKTNSFLVIILLSYVVHG